MIEETDTQVYEEWVAYPDKRVRVPVAEHGKQAVVQGWFISGWRGVGPDMQPLSEEQALKFAPRD